MSPLALPRPTGGRARGLALRPAGLLRRAVKWLAFAVAAYWVIVYASARVHWVAMAAGGPPPPLPPAPAARVVGALHVHTSRSHDAIGTESELARAARAAGLDFVFLADHRSGDSAPAEWEGAARREEGVLLVRGQEIRVEGAGKVLVDRLDTAVVSWTGGAESFFGRVARDSAFAVVAHPRGRPGDAWRPPDAAGVAAWEVFDFADVARRRLASPAVFYHLAALVGGELAGRSERSWLRLYRDGFRAPGVAAFDSLWAGGGPGPTAVGGLDMHPKVRLPGGRLLPSYASSLRTIINHVALGAPLESRPERAARALGAAMRRGDVFLSFGDAEEARGFRVGLVARGTGDVPARPGASAAAARGGDDAPAAGESGSRARSLSHIPPGGSAAMVEGLRLEAGFATHPGRIAYRVVRDGREQGWRRGAGLGWAVDAPGAYRIEVYRYSARLGRLVWNLRPWIFVNPVLVRPPAGGG